MIKNERQRIHTTFSNSNMEIIEEFDRKSQLLLMRKIKTVGVLGGSGSWSVEVGEDDAATQQMPAGIKLSSATPFITRKDTKMQFTWRIRNLIWPKDVYCVTTEGTKITVKTSNKKYYTTIAVSDMIRLGLSLEQSAIEWDWGASTLVIAYRKPAKVIELEEFERKERGSMGNALDTKTTAGNSDQPPDCKQQ